VTELPPDWPHREASASVTSGGLRWHVQQLGAGPALLLLHGTGASLHSWSGLLPLLAQSFRVLALDLPGHGFTEAPGAEGFSLPGMARSIAGLLQTLDFAPTLVLGHSAGAAVAARLCLDGAMAPAAIISLNGALEPFSGLQAQLFRPAAKLLSALSFVPAVVALQAQRPQSVERMVASTGSSLSPEALDHYRYLVQMPGHVGAALKMMANWDLATLHRDLPRLEPRLWLLVCSNDRAVPEAQARRLHRCLPRSRLRLLSGLGHLGHEEDPEQFRRLTCEIAVEEGVLPG
jgi:magnesium chelatase accessory protein